MRPEKLGLACLLLLAGCSGGTAVRGEAPDAAAITGYLVEIEAWPPERLAAEIRQLQGTPLSPTGRLRLAWLLARDGARTEELVRAQNLLAGQEDAFADAGSRQLFLLVRRLVDVQLDLAVERRRAAELHAKIERLKELERELHERARTPEVE